MKSSGFLFVGILLMAATISNGQSSQAIRLAFVSDTQAPMTVEKIWLKANRNEEATGKVFEDIVKIQPHTVFLLGDVVALGYREKKWKRVDGFLNECRSKGITAEAVLGNHDVMTFGRSGEKKFQMRFPDQVRTGFTVVRDSIAIVMLNSNFKKLGKAGRNIQEEWLGQEINRLDKDPAIVHVIVSCHHAPYSNSKIVGSSKPVQERFVPYFYSSIKARIFITGHSHNFERFTRDGKDFLVIGGGGGIHQPLNQKPDRLDDISGDYKPDFHYITLQRSGHTMTIVSRALSKDFSGFSDGYTIKISRP